MRRYLAPLLPLLLATTLLLASGCVSASGSLGDVQVTVKSGYFTESDPYASYDGEEYDGSFNVSLASFNNFCGVQAGYSDASNMAEDAGDAQDAWEMNFPEDFWVVYIHVIAEDTNISQRGASFDGVDWDDDEVRDGEFWAELIHVTEYPDKDFFEGMAFLDEFADIFWSDGGSLQINGHTVDRSLAGKLTADAVWIDEDEDFGDDAGTVTVNFDVDTCVDIYY